ncbi:MAG TPA: hypothetical protein VF710_20580 [Longimicrobium sp.]|jgi:hypothetical protein
MRSAAVLALLLFALPAAAQDDAYRDPRARELVRLARARRAVVDTRITGYQVTARERISARMSVMGIEKLLFRRETASRVDWSRDTVRVEVIGAREAIPAVRVGAQRISPDNIAGSAMVIAFDPADPEMLLRFDSTVIRNPLAAGSEAHYRYSSGDSLSIRLPNGRGVRILELRIAARRADPHLINGSFWLDSETHAVVRAGFRQSRPFSSTGSGITVVMPEAGAELDFVAIDYGFWDRRWWLPRSVAARGVAHFGGRRFPLSYERTYEGYQVTGDTLAAAPTRQSVAEGAVATPPRCRRQITASINIGSGVQSDSSWEAAWDRQMAEMAAADTAKSDSTTADSTRAPKCTQAFVVTRAPGTDLVSGPAFPAGIYDEKEGAVSEQDLRTLTDLVRDLPGTPWSIGKPGVRLLSPETIRFNRIEGLSVGPRASLPLGPAELRAEVRAGTTGEIGARLAGIHSTAALRTEVAAYRGLEAVAVPSQPFSLGSSASALLLGRDENDYFRATGAELRLSPAATRRQRWDVRLFAEHQRGVSARTDVSLRGAFDDGFDARENVLAETLDQAGATVRVRASRGDDPSRLRTRAELELHGETGGATFGRPLLRLGAEGPVGAGVGYGLSLAGGTGFGEVPVQRFWQIGGATTVRGHDPASMRGETLWLARAELTRGAPMMRLSLFGDAGWAGDAADLWDARPLRGMGVGVAFLDNLVRFDLAQGLGGGGFHLHLRMGGGI